MKIKKMTSNTKEKGVKAILEIFVIVLAVFFCKPLGAQVNTDYQTGLDYGNYHSHYNEVSSNASLWQPCSTSCDGTDLTLADFNVQDVLKYFKAQNSKIPQVQLRSKKVDDWRPMENELIIVPGGYVRASFTLIAEYLASKGYQVLFIKPNPESTFKQSLDLVNQEIEKHRWIIDKAENVYFLGSHIGSGLSLILSENIKAKGLISIEGNETWKSKDFGYNQLKEFVDFSKIEIPIHRFFTSNPEPSWYFSSPENTILSFYDSYKGKVAISELPITLEHDGLSDLCFWFYWEPNLLESGNKAPIESYIAFIESIVNQLNTWK